LRLLRARQPLKESTGLELGIVRIGQSAKVHEDVKSCLLHNLVERRWNENNQAGRRNVPRKMMRDSELTTAQVILSTLNSVQVASMGLFKQAENEIRCVIVDEASQCTEPELLMPLVYPISKLILIGDHK